MSTGMRLDIDEVGGAVVNRVFTFQGERLMRGHRLTREQVLSIPTRNREALVSEKVIREFPKGSAAAQPLPEGGGELFLVRRPDLRYDVVQGVRVNAEPLPSKAEAIALQQSLEVPPAVPPEVEHTLPEPSL